MKQLLSSQSTHPGEYLYTDFSIIAIPSNSNRQSITKIISYIKNVLKMRLYLCFRDIQEIYNNQTQFLKRIFDVQSAEQLWKKLNKTEEGKLMERQIMGLLTKIVLILTKQKNNTAQKKQFQTFAELKSTIQWLEDQIVQMEKQIRDKIKQAAIHRRTESQSLRKKLFEQEGQLLKQTIDFTTKQFNFNLKRQHKREKEDLENSIISRVQKQKYHFIPSKRLNEAKDKALLAKLAPFKSQKKRPYQCRSLQKQLETTTQQGKQLMREKIEEFKRTERNKIKRKQMIESEGVLSKIQNKNNQTLAKLQLRREQLDKSENTKMKRMLQENDKITRERITSLKNSLRAFSKKDQTNQIRNIIKTHRETIQFVNNLDDISQTVMHKDYSLPKYATLDLSSEWTKNQKARRYEDEMLESKILRKIRNSDQSGRYNEDGLQKSPGRRSLVDLYDEQLNKL